MRPWAALSVLALALGVFAEPSPGAVPRLINYQGILTDTTGAPVDGEHDLTFRIYADSLSGAASWSESHIGVALSRGVFSVVLGGVTPLADAVFAQPNRWLGVALDTESETAPRMRLTSVPWAMRASIADSAITGGGGDGTWEVSGGNVYRHTGNVGVGTINPTSTVDVRGLTQITDDGASPDGLNYATFSVTRANAQVNSSYIGLTKQGRIPWGLGIDPNDKFIIGLASPDPARTIPDPCLAIQAWTGNVGIGTTSPGYKMDVAGQVRSISGGFVFPDGSVQTTASAGGISNWAANGSNIYSTNSGNVGIGTTAPSDKLDVAGGLRIHERFKFSQNGFWANLDLFTGHSTAYPRLYLYETVNGGSREQTGLYSKGVLSIRGLTATASSGNGVDCSTSYDSDGSTALRAVNTALTSNCFGVYGEVSSQTNGIAPGIGGAGSAVAIYGRSRSAVSSGGATLAVLGRNDATSTVPGSDVAAGVFGWAPGSSGSPAEFNARVVGVWGETWSVQKDVPGVYGLNKAASGETRGVIGRVESSSPGAAGILGVAGSSGQVRAVMGYCHSTSGYGVYSDGNFAVAPGYTKSALVTTQNTTAKVYCQESPEVWFEDFGEATLSGGTVTIDLDPRYLDAVTIDGEHPMRVYIQQTAGDPENMVVNKGTNGFTIRSSNSASTATCDYRIVAKRKGFEADRFEVVDVPTGE